MSDKAERGMVARWRSAGLALALASGTTAPAIATEATPVDFDLLEVKAWTADEHELPAVEREIVRTIQLHPDSAKAHYLLSHVLVRVFSRDPGDLYVMKQASDLAQQAVDLAPRSDVGYVALANILDLMGQADRGLILLDEAEKAGLEPSWRFYFTRSRLMSDDAKVIKVLGLLESALAFSDAQPKIIVPYVVALLQSEAQGAELVEKLQTWNDRFPSPLFQLTKAITYTELGEFRKASEIYEAIIKAHPNNKEAKVNNAIVLYRDLKDGTHATTMLEEALAQHGAVLARPARSMITAHLGAAYLQRKMYPEAEASFLGALKQDQGNLSLIDFLTRSYRDAKAHDQLVSLIRQLNDQISGTGVLHALLGETLSEKLDQHDDALRAFSDAITLDPDRSDYYNGMGLAYYRKKSYGDALQLFGAAGEIDPNDATARYNQACVLALMGRVDEAVNVLAEALTLDPRLTQTARADSDFDAIKGNMRYMDLVREPLGSDGDVIGH